MKGAIALGITLVLAGCQSTRMADRPLILSTPPVDQGALQATADSIARQLQSLPKQPEAVVQSVRGSFPETSDREALADIPVVVTAQWMGPVEPLLQQVAAQWKGQLQTVGKPHALPILVDIRAEKMDLAQFIEQIRYQVRDQATCVINPHTRLITLYYRSGQ